MAINPIDRVSGLSLEEFRRRFIAPGLPVILEDATRDWPAISKWNQEYLESRAGDLNIQLRSIDPRKGSASVLKTSLKSYLNQLETAAPTDPYLAEQPLKLIFPLLLEDIGTFPYSNGSAESLAIMLSANSRAPLHYHETAEAISHQIVGERRFLLFPPSETSKLDPRPALGQYPNFARRIFREEEAASGPERVFDAKLSPGDALYIPRHWWHTVYANCRLSVLLVHFFSHQHSTAPKNEVAQRIEEPRLAIFEAISYYERTFSSSTKFDDKRFCIQRLLPLYGKVKDEEREGKFLSTAIGAFPQSSTERAQMETRLAELSGKKGLQTP